MADVLVDLLETLDADRRPVVERARRVQREQQLAVQKFVGMSEGLGHLVSEWIIRKDDVRAALHARKRHMMRPQAAVRLERHQRAAWKSFAHSERE